MPQLPGGWELILILLVVVMVFGYKRLPDSARAVGRSMRILKAETKGLREDDASSTTTAAQVQAVPSPTPAPSPAPLPDTQPYAGQQLFDAEGRPVQAPVNGSARVQPAPQAGTPQA